MFSQRTVLQRRRECSDRNDIECDDFSFRYFLQIKKDGQMNLLRDANLQLKSQVFELNQDIVDLLEIIENQKNRRLVSDILQMLYYA